MQITLKQSEIEAGVRQYISDQGINLAGKTVTIDFTATRVNGGGILATVDIEKAPNAVDGPVTRTGLQVVSQATPVLAAVSETPGPAFVADAPFAIDEAAGNDPVVVDESPKAKATSLFG